MTAIPFPEEVRDRVTSYIQHQGAKSPEALVELVKTSQLRFLDAVSGVGDDLAARKPAPEEWSLRELIRHVIDAEESVALLIHHLSRGGRPPASERGPGRMVEDDGRPFSDYVEQVRTINQNLIYAVEGMPADPNLDEKAPHPFFGPLNCKEWAAFQRVHDEDHVQHAKKILDAVGP
jgi:hypothetical protein